MVRKAGVSHQRAGMAVGQGISRLPMEVIWGQPVVEMADRPL